MGRGIPEYLMLSLFADYISTSPINSNLCRNPTIHTNCFIRLEPKFIKHLYRTRLLSKVPNNSLNYLVHSAPSLERESFFRRTVVSLVPKSTLPIRP